MKKCKDCNVIVNTEKDNCILCGAVLEKDENENCKKLNAYPDFSNTLAEYNFFYRIAVFISLCGIILSVLVNLLTMPSFLWSLIVIAGVLYFWVVVPPLLHKGVDFAKQTLMLVLFTSVLVTIIDIIIGYKGWSLNYIVPCLCIAGTVIIVLMTVFNRTNWAQYALYQVLMGFFGLVPLILYFIGLSKNIIIVIVCAALSVLSLLGTAVFGDKTIKSEFKRRFHF